MAAVEDDQSLTIGTMVLTPRRYWLDNPAEVADAQEWIEAEQVEIAGRRPIGESEPFQPPPQRLTLAVDEAAATLGITRASAYEAVRRGEIPHIRIGNRILVSRSQLEKMLDTDSPTAEESDAGSDLRK
jgi:excisionase family DNA binding protein